MFENLAASGLGMMLRAAGIDVETLAQKAEIVAGEAQVVFRQINDFVVQTDFRLTRIENMLKDMQDGRNTMSGNSEHSIEVCPPSERGDVLRPSALLPFHGGTDWGPSGNLGPSHANGAGGANRDE